MKLIIYLLIFLFSVIIVSSLVGNIETFYNQFGSYSSGNLQWIISNNQTDYNWTFGNITATIFLGDGSELTGILVTINGTSVNLTNLFVVRNITALGNISANFYHGDGSLLTGISAGGTSVWNSSGSNVYLNDSIANILLAGSLNVTGTLNVSGNVQFDGNLVVGDKATDQILTAGTFGQSTPDYSFINDPDTGMSHQNTAGAIYFHSQGSQILRVDGDGLLINPDGTASNPSIQIGFDGDTGLFQPSEDKLAFTAGAREFLRFDETTQDIVIFNEDSRDHDFRVETNNNANMFFIDGGNDRIGIGTNTPTEVLVVIGNANVTGNLKIDGNVSMGRVLTEVVFEKKIDIGVPGAGGGLDVGEGGSYTTDKDGTTIVQAFTYDASATSGSRFTSLTLDASNTWLGDTGDRFYVCSQKIFWAVRFEISRGKTDEPLEIKYYDGTSMVGSFYMGILKNNATSVGLRILNQTAEKEYITWDHEISTNWTTADNVLDTIPDLTANSYCVAFEVPSTGLATAPIVTEIKARGTDFDIVTGTSYPILWGNTRVENHERIPLTVVKSPGATTTIDIDIDSAHKQTVFDFDGAGDLVSFIWNIPEAIDTSSPIHVTLDYAANAADTFDIDLSMSKLRNATAIGSGIAPDFTETTAITSDTANTFYTGVVLADTIPIQNMSTSDELSFEIQRTDTGNAMYPLSFIIHYISFSIGEIVTAD